MLLGLHPSDPIAEQVLKVHSEWNKLNKQHSLCATAVSKFLIMFCSSVLDELLKQCHKVILFFKKSFSKEDAVEDSEDVYYHFAGAAIASLLHARYDKLKQNAANEQLSQETTILEKLSIYNRQEKDHISSSLKYRGKGHMYFPCKDLLPVIKEIDLCTKTFINAEAFKKYGSQLLVVLSHKFVQDTKLQLLYRVILQAKVSVFIQMNENIVDSVFKEFVQKLCHTRIQEFLDSFKQQCTACKCFATLGGQNLKDSLFSHHVNLKCKQR